MNDFWGQLLGGFVHAPFFKFVVGALLVLVVLSGLMRLSSRGPRNFSEGRVTGVVGRKRSGKSAYTIHTMLRHLDYPVRVPKWIKGPRKVRGHVAANFALKVSPADQARVHLIKDWSDVFVPAELDDEGNIVRQAYSPLPAWTLIELDEAGGWFPPTPGMVLDRDVSDFLAMLGKFHLELIWIHQSYAGVASGLKAQTDVMMKVRRGMFRSHMLCEGWDKDDFEKVATRGGYGKTNVLHRERFRMTKRIADAYDTYEFISPPSSGLMARASSGAAPRQRGGRSAASANGFA